MLGEFRGFVRGPEVFKESTLSVAADGGGFRGLGGDTGDCDGGHDGGPMTKFLGPTCNERADKTAILFWLCFPIWLGTLLSIWHAGKYQERRIRSRGSTQPGSPHRASRLLTPAGFQILAAVSRGFFLTVLTVGGYWRFFWDLAARPAKWARFLKSGASFAPLDPTTAAAAYDVDLFDVDVDDSDSQSTLSPPTTLCLSVTFAIL
ncbi:unnamed protein product, partial [Notodromas monacha]